MKNVELEPIGILCIDGWKC